MIFLRPWFLLLAVVPIVFRVFRERLNTAFSWDKVIDEKLLPYLLIKGTGASARKRSAYKTIIWIFLCFALSGPAWEKETVPTETAEPGTVIVLEISQIMSGQNLVRAQQKIYDILDRLEGEQVGLVLYDRFGYTAGPLTFELDIIRDMVPSLDMSVLPEAKINPNAGFEQANRILDNAGIQKGRILFLTTGVDWPNDFILNAKKNPHEIAVLGIGSEIPYPVPLKTGGFLSDEKNQPLMFSLDKKKMSQIGAYHSMTADDADIRYLLEKTSVDSVETRISGQDMTLWKDMGGYFVLAILPFFALLFRKGVLMGLLLFYGLSAEASLWRRPDQEAYDKQMIGVQNYRSKFYERAEGIFKSGKNADDVYNYGNALAFQQKIEEAIEAYRNVLVKDPKHEDARFNKEYLEKKLEEERKRQEEEKRRQEEEQLQKEQKENLEQLQNLLKQEENLKQQEIEELEKQQQKEEPLSLKQEHVELKDEIVHEYTQKQEQQKQVSELLSEKEDVAQQKLKDLQQQLREEIQNNQERQEQIQDDPELKMLKKQIQRENELKQKGLEVIDKMLPEEKEENKTQNEIQQHQEEQEQQAEKDVKPQEQAEEQNASEQEEKEAVFDQESQEVLNHLQQDPDSILRYRIRQQYLRKTGGIK